MNTRRELFRRLIASLAALVLAQGATPGGECPKLHGQTLDGKSVVLPDIGAGKVMLIIVGASRKGGERTDAWKSRFIGDFGSNPRATYYVAALLESVPAPFRGMIRAGMRRGTPEAARKHVLTCASDEATWKKYLAMNDDSLPGVVLLDESGRLLWNYTGTFDLDHYQALKAAALGVLQHS